MCNVNVIFDMDGVIFDTERFCLECCVPAAEKVGLDNIAEISMQCIGLTKEATDQRLRDYYGPEAPLDQFDEELSRIFTERYEKEGMPVKDGARELLFWLKEKGIPVALASSTRTDIVCRELKETGLYEYFDAIVGGDMVDRSKPAPDIFLKAAELLSCGPEQCTVIEDSFHGIRAAAAAGMQPVMVPDLLEPDGEIRALAHAIRASLFEVLDDFQEILAVTRVDKKDDSV